MEIMQMLDGLEPLLKTFWLIAIPSSLIFLVQTAATFIGMNAFDGVEANFDGHLDGHGGAFQLFSFRNFINFFLGVGWTGISFYARISNPTWLIFLSLAVGCFLVYIFFVIMNQLQKLTEDNSFKLSNTVGKVGEVYIPIPSKMSGTGKISISVKGSIHELDAMTISEKALPSNTKVKVISAEDDSILIVEPFIF